MLQQQITDTRRRKTYGLVIWYLLIVSYDLCPQWRQGKITLGSILNSPTASLTYFCLFCFQTPTVCSFLGNNEPYSLHWWFCDANHPCPRVMFARVVRVCLLGIHVLEVQTESVRQAKNLELKGCVQLRCVFSSFHKVWIYFPQKGKERDWKDSLFLFNSPFFSYSQNQIQHDQDSMCIFLTCIVFIQGLNRV